MPEGKGHVATVGEAPTYVNTRHIPPQALPAAASSAESSPRKDLFDMSRFSIGLSFSSLLRLLFTLLFIHYTSNH
jgi:hypothetical protein